MQKAEDNYTKTNNFHKQLQMAVNVQYEHFNLVVLS